MRMTWQRREIFLVAVFALAALFGLWHRVVWGGLIPDECYTWLQCIRFEHGDAPFSYEWSTHVTTSFLLWPVYKIYKFLGMGNDGLLIFTRRGFVVIWLVFLALTYSRWRRVSKRGAMFGILAIVFLPPRYSFNLSYNSIGFMGVSLASTMYIVPSSWRKAELFVSGILLAMACVCIPHLVVLCAAFFVYAFFKDRKALTFVFMGMFFMGSLYAYSLLSIVSLSDIIKAVPFVAGDPEHAWGGINALLAVVVRSIGGCMGLSLLGIGFLVLATFTVVDLQSRRHFIVYWTAGVLLTEGALLYYALFKSANALNTLSCSLAYLGGLTILASRECSLRPILWFGVATGFAFAMIFSIASNTGTLAAAVGLEIAVVPSVVMMFALPEKMKWGKMVRVKYTAGLMLVLASYFFNEFVVALYKDYPDEAVPSLSGPLRGLYSTKNDLIKRNQIMTDICTVTTDSRIRNILIIERFGVWENLVVDKEMSAPWSWCRPIDQNLMKSLLAYWEWHPEKTPDLVFVIKAQREAFACVFSGYAFEHRYQNIELSSGNEIYLRADMVPSMNTKGTKM